MAFFIGMAVWNHNTATPAKEFSDEELFEIYKQDFNEGAED